MSSHRTLMVCHVHNCRFTCAASQTCVLVSGMIPDLSRRLEDTVEMPLGMFQPLFFEYGRAVSLDTAGDVLLQDCAREIQEWCGRNGVVFGGIESASVVVPSMSCGRAVMRVVASLVYLN